jgi:hypothetical protein
MKKISVSFLSYLVVSIFLIYWATLFILAFAPTDIKQLIGNKMPEMSAMAIGSWKLFTPPYMHDHRLYYVVSDTNRQEFKDTVEVLKGIAEQKRKNAPFNQKEEILDFLINKNAVRLIRTASRIQAKYTEDEPGYMDSIHATEGTKFVQGNVNYPYYLTTLVNYGRAILKPRYDNTDGKIFKIVLTEKLMRPFKYRNDDHYQGMETLFFESDFIPLREGKFDK